MAWEVWDEYTRRVDPKGYSEHLRACRDRAKEARKAENDAAFALLASKHGIDVAGWPDSVDALLYTLQESGMGVGRTAAWVNAILKHRGIQRRYSYRRAFNSKGAVTITPYLEAWIMAHLRMDSGFDTALADIDAASYQHLCAKLGAETAEPVNAWLIAATLREMGFKLKRRSYGMAVLGASLHK